MTTESPCRIWVLDDWPIERSLLRRVADSIPGCDWPRWVRYESARERKRTSRDLWLLSEPTCRLFWELGSIAWLEQLTALTGINGLVLDPLLHGAGIHVSESGGALAPHLDYARHPVLGLERRLSAVLFLSPEWRGEWGGALQFWDSLAAEVCESISPRFGRVVVWENSDLAYHSVSPVQSPDVPRITAAAYYLSAPRPQAVRSRALFVPER